MVKGTPVCWCHVSIISYHLIHLYFSSSGTASNEKVQALEHRVLKLLDELNVLHKTKGEVINIQTCCHTSWSVLRNFQWRTKCKKISLWQMQNHSVDMSFSRGRRAFEQGGISSPQYTCHTFQFVKSIYFNRVLHYCEWSLSKIFFLYA